MHACIKLQGLRLSLGLKDLLVSLTAALIIIDKNENKNKQSLIHSFIHSFNYFKGEKTNNIYIVANTHSYEIVYTIPPYITFSIEFLLIESTLLFHLSNH